MPDAFRQNEPPRLDVTFHDYLVPRADPGVYTVHAEHLLKEADGTRVDTDPLPAAEQKFEVRAARFTLHETSVHAYYPPAGTSGRYDAVLPHITLDRAILPWERSLTGVRSRARAPWVALLVFREGELPDDPAAAGDTVLRTVAELIKPTEQDVIGPSNLRGITSGIAASKCATIDVPREVFRRVAPYQEEMYYLAHVRDVVRPVLGAQGEVLTEGKYAVVTANRFPREAGRYTAHLVSLEGYEAQLEPGAPGTHRALRLVSLSSWSFTTDLTHALDIPDMLQHLVEPSWSGDPEDLALRINPPKGEPADDAERYARARLALGYAPVPFRTLSGELTYAWYRGPATPVTTPDVPGQAGESGHTTADHALIYERENGLFDVSYATAWTLGRTIALADPDYSAQITRARRELGNRAATLRAMAADPVRARTDPDAGRGLAALHELAADGGRSLAAALTDRADPGPTPRVTGRRRLNRAEGRALLTEERSMSLLRATAERNTGDMPAWLDELGLLRGIPFCYLVPDPRMLPPESMRMFRIDEQWLDAVLAGASDVGMHTSMDRDLDPQLRAVVGRSRRTELRPGAGLLINSELVKAWPDFPLVAKTADGTPIVELRQDRLATNLILYLFRDVPDVIEIREPGQGIHFGIDAGDRINLRSLGGAGNPPLGEDTGASFPAPDHPDTDTVFCTYLRDRPDGGTKDVLRLCGDAGLVSGLAAAFELDDLTPSQFALQMVNSPVLQRLAPKPPAFPEATTATTTGSPR
ncbi:hypothetical protein [Streptomyces inhibens]|uniref:hypothetical protein n=1 Tax=Streptomyces inhibens TaxID=2293571 RepID=UPI001EE693E2|nr:hypothetical protein [Streptomyces inhibens]UKY48520.1 hypothetical protein KI385_06720 [Streptomyces inhibens]